MKLDMMQLSHRDHQAKLARMRTRLVYHDGGPSAAADLLDRLVDEIEAVATYFTISESAKYRYGIGKQFQFGLAGMFVQGWYDGTVTCFRLWGGHDPTVNWTVPVMSDRTAIAAILAAITAKVASDPTLFWRAA
jgi:hypothetical protein